MNNVNRGAQRGAQFTLGFDPDRHDILEIGALNRPSFSPRHPRVKFIDYLSRADLVKKFSRYPDFDTTQIVPINYIVENYDYHSAVGNDRFDLVLGSHVIEHVPNMMGWIQNISLLLRPLGVLSLIIPDKRVTFDTLRKETTWADLVSYELSETNRPDLRRILDHVAHAVTVAPEQLWSGSVNPQELPRIHSVTQAYALARQLSTSNEYFDIHCNIFSPAGFLDALNSLCHLSWPNLLLNSFHETSPGEMDFFVSFVKMPEDTN